MPKSTKTHAEHIEALKAKKSALEARIKKAEAREKEKERKLDTKRKILIGAIVQLRAENDPAFAATLKKWIDQGLTNDRDRQLFDLPVRPEPKIEQPAPAYPSSTWPNVANTSTSS